MNPTCLIFLQLTPITCAYRPSCWVVAWNLCSCLKGSSFCAGLPQDVPETCSLSQDSDSPLSPCGAWSSSQGPEAGPAAYWLIDRLCHSTFVLCGQPVLPLGTSAPLLPPMATATPLPPETAVVTLGASLLFSPHRTCALWAPPFSPTFCPGHGLLTAMATPFSEEVSGTYLPSPMPDEPPNLRPCRSRLPAAVGEGSHAPWVPSMMLKSLVALGPPVCPHPPCPTTHKQLFLAFACHGRPLLHHLPAPFIRSSGGRSSSSS